MKTDAIPDRWRHLGLKVFRFFLVGIPAFLVAVPLNFALVRWVGMPEPGAYAIVLVFQVSINFLLCRWFVFETDREAPVLRQFAAFLAGILGFRLLDWALYTALVHYFGLYFLAAQLLNVAIFGAGKFLFSRRLLEPRPAPPK